MQPIDKSLALLGTGKNATLTEIKNAYKYGDINLNILKFKEKIFLGKKFLPILPMLLEQPSWRKSQLLMLKSLRIFSKKLYSKAVKILHVRKYCKNVKNYYQGRYNYT